MFRIDDATAASSLPAPETAGTEGYFTEGNPTAGTPATNVRGSWLNMIQEELCAILAAAGIARSKTTYNQVNSALQKMYASPVGTVRNLSMSVSAASASATLAADQIVVASALGGQPYVLSSFSKTINLATTGAGGMDTGTAPASGFVALYAIYNPTTGASALLATNASTKQGNVYGGANMPAGYAASALLSVWPTNSSGQFVIGSQTDRFFSWVGAFVLSSSTVAASFTSLSISGGVPANAKTIGGQMQLTSTASSAMSMGIAADANGIGQQAVSAGASGTAFTNIGNYSLSLTTPQTIYYKNTNVSGTPTFGIYVDSYTI